MCSILAIEMNTQKTRPHHTNGVGAPLINGRVFRTYIHIKKCVRRAETLTCILHNLFLIVKYYQAILLIFSKIIKTE